MAPGTEYLRDLCDEKHKTIDREIETLFAKIRSLDNRLWAILVLLLANLITTFFRVCK